MNIVTPTAIDAGGMALLRLQTWLSPSFPVGAYTYSHGLEYAIEAGAVTDGKGLGDWAGGALRFGAGRLDAAFFRAAWEGVAENDDDKLACAIIQADAMRATKELALEAEAQGAAFLEAVKKAWDFPVVTHIGTLLDSLARPASYPVVVGAVAAGAGIALRPALQAYLHAFIANIVSAGVRLVPLGQSDGLRALASLETAVLEASEAALSRKPDELGSATPMIDWASMQHETQYTRLFRS